jgi:hypothetical protein
MNKHHYVNDMHSIILEENMYEYSKGAVHQCSRRKGGKAVQETA